MTTVTSPPVQQFGTLADLVEQLGNVPLGRIRIDPPPGTATEEDMVRAEGHTGRCCELIDGVDATLTGGDVLSGFTLSLRELFAETGEAT